MAAHQRSHVKPADYIPDTDPQDFPVYHQYASAILTGLIMANPEVSQKEMTRMAQRAHLLAEAALDEYVRRNQQHFNEYSNLY